MVSQIFNILIGVAIGIPVGYQIAQRFKITRKDDIPDDKDTRRKIYKSLS